MSFSRLIPLFCVLFINQAVAQVPDIGQVSEVGVGRVGDNVVRYIKIFGSGCLNIQVISPEKKWEVLSFSSFCEFEGKNFDSDFAEAGFEDISIEADGIHLVLSLTPLQPTGEQRRYCVIPVNKVIRGAVQSEDSGEEYERAYCVFIEMGSGCIVRQETGSFCGGEWGDEGSIWLWSGEKVVVDHVNQINSADGGGLSGKGADENFSRCSGRE